jgi:hypothetical protein
MISPRRTTREMDRTGKQGEVETRLTDKVLKLVGIWDAGEDVRRRSDRLGARLWYGHHWGIAMPDGRAAVTCNIAMSLAAHKISIMTKQDPVPVVETDDVGDEQAARLMRSILIRRWEDDNLKIKLRRALSLAEACRTTALKVGWDHESHNAAGDTFTDVVEPWRLILDNRADDPDRMEFCGDRAQMPRSRALLMYPEAADKLEAKGEKDGYRSQSGGTTTIGSTRGIPGPWGYRAGPVGTPSLVNGKPVVTAYAGEPPGEYGEDQVEIIELYYKDRTMIEREEVVKDHFGNPKMQMVRDEEGEPQFNELPPEPWTDPADGQTHLLPAFEIQYEQQKETKLTFKYPHYRRTTVLVPDGLLLEDIAWDHPLPYCFFNAQEPLEGILSRGTILQVQQLQSVLNVTVSSMTDILRLGNIKAWFAGAQSGLATDIIVARPGQVIPVGEVSQIKPVEMTPFESSMFEFVKLIVELMERIMGASGIMTGKVADAAPRMDSAVGVDSLGEIAGSRIVEATQRMEVGLARWANLVAHFVQKYYDERHSIAVDTDTGDISYERAWRPDLQGTLSCRYASGSSLAWSESAAKNRMMAEIQAGLADKIAYWQRFQTPDWQIMAKRMVTGPPQLEGAAGAPPRTRQTIPKKGGKKPPQ